MRQLYLESISSTIIFISIVANAERFGCRKCQKRLAISILFIKYVVTGCTQDLKEAQQQQQLETC